MISRSQQCKQRGWSLGRLLWLVLNLFLYGQVVAASEDRGQPSRTEGQRLQNSIGMEFVKIEPGVFLMGRPDQGQNLDIPQRAAPHKVEISKAYYLGAFEVTQAEYETVTGENPSALCSDEKVLGHFDRMLAAYRSSHPDLTKLAPDSYPRMVLDMRAAYAASGDPGDYPVESVSWYDADRFCRKLSERPAEKQASRRYRLPTEAEWEFACRAGSEQAYKHTVSRELEDRRGDNAKKYMGASLPLTAVGGYPPNAFGLYDMRGSVFEWCDGWYNGDYYANSPSADPPGPDDGVLKVVRGGDWCFIGEGCTIARSPTEPGKQNPFIGFRVVCEID